MKIRVLLFYAIVLLNIQCKKVHPDNDVQETQPEEKTGFDYFLNTNETWFYKLQNPPNPSVFINETFYSVIKDTSGTDNGYAFKGKWMLQEMVEFSIFEGDTFNRNVFINNFILYYRPESRTLNYLDDTKFVFELADFKGLDTAENCTMKINWRDTMKICSNYYNRWINAANMEIIEGIHLRIHDCAPVSLIGNAGIPLVEFRYSSDQCIYEWKAP